VNVPKNFKTKWKIIQNVVGNPEFMDLYRNKDVKEP